MELTKEQVKDNWEELGRKFPLICGLKTLNAELTIYACLQQAYKQFDYVVITDDGSTDNTMKMIEKCVNDFNIRNVSVIDVSNWDPMPDQVIEKREGDHHVTRPAGQTHAKAQFKNYEVVKKNFPNAIYVSLEDDVILYDNVRARIYNEIIKWDDPFTDCEFFNVTSMVDRDHTIEVAYNNQRGVPIPGMQFRKLYDNAGDYTLAAWWCCGDITVGPDPNYPFGACLFPWLPKNQMGKKGQSTIEPFGFHLMNFRTSKQDYSYPKDAAIVRFDSLEDEHVDNSLFDNVSFPLGEIKINDKFENYLATK